MDDPLRFIGHDERAPPSGHDKHAPQIWGVTSGTFPIR